ncbi:hypothetical protein Tco_0262477, partial [Tanacetum coccineum]
MMMLILRGRIVRSGRRPQIMKLMYLESHHLDKFFKRNKLHQLQDNMEEVLLTIDEAKLRKMPDDVTTVARA